MIDQNEVVTMKEYSKEIQNRSRLHQGKFEQVAHIIFGHGMSTVDAVNIIGCLLMELAGQVSELTGSNESAEELCGYLNKGFELMPSPEHTIAQRLAFLSGCVSTSLIERLPIQE